MFDDSKPFEFPILSGGEKWAKVRWPTDEEFCQRTRDGRQHLKQINKTQSEWVYLNQDECDYALFQKIRLDDENEAEPFDEQDAAKFLQQLTYCEPEAVVYEGGQFEIKLKVADHELEHQTVTHYLKMPTAKDLLELQRKGYRRFDQRHTNATDVRFLMEPIGELWDRLQVRHEGYANGHVPITHKQAAVYEVRNRMEEMEEGFASGKKQRPRPASQTSRMSGS
jgi:hypothetical protein